MSEDTLGQNLRQMRQALGLTQTQLADRLGVRQGTLSRWESGVEPIPSKRRHALIDLLSNGRDALHPVLERLCRRRDVSIWTMDKTYARISDAVSNALRIEKSDAIGARSDELFESDPNSVRTTLRVRYGEDYLSRISYLCCDTDFLRRGTDDRFANARLRTTSYAFSTRDWDQLVVTRSEVLSRARGEPCHIQNLVVWSDFDV